MVKKTDIEAAITATAGKPTPVPARMTASKVIEGATAIIEAAFTQPDADDVEGWNADQKKQFLAQIDKASVNDLAKSMAGKFNGNLLFPSNWNNFFPGVPYPVKLAQALIKTKDRESVTDFLNTYYHPDRMVSPEALEVFLNDAIAQLKGADDQDLELWSMGQDGQMPNGWDKAMKKNPGACSKMILALPKAFVQKEMADKNAANYDFGKAVIKFKYPGLK